MHEVNPTTEGLMIDSLKAPAISYLVECLDADGNMKWSETIEND